MDTVESSAHAPDSPPVPEALDTAASTPPPFLLSEGRTAPPDTETPSTEDAPEVPPAVLQEARRAEGPAVLRLLETAADEGDRPSDLPMTLEGLLFVAEEPPLIRHLAEATNVSKDAVEAALDELEGRLAARGLRLQRSGETVRLVSAPECAPWVERFLGLERPNRLSKAALETLAIIVYRQPVTRVEVERVRGVSCDGPFHTLRARELIEPVGQTDGPGRPNLWAVTQRFLDHFGLGGLDELPPLPELTPPAEQRRIDWDADASDGDERPGLPSDSGSDDGSPDASEPESAESEREYAAAGGSGD